MTGRSLDDASLDAAVPPMIEGVLPLFAEEATVAKRIRRTRVTARRSTTIRREAVSADLMHDHVVVERIAVGRIVDAVPPVRVEDGVTIMPVVEEQVVMTRRLFLKEEVHVRQVRGVTRHAASVELRQHEATVTRTALDPKHEPSPHMHEEQP